jgi:hypothetical protein
MKTTARGIVGAIMIAVVLSGCGSAQSFTGVLTGQAWSCSLGRQVSSTTVYVFASIYAREDSAALQRVTHFGVDSGEHVVATQRVASGDTYRFDLHPGHYIVYDSEVGSARLVTVVGQGLARADFSRSCF